MGYQRISEVLQQPMNEVRNDGALLGVNQLAGETDATYRDRVAYAMQAKLFTANGRALTQRILDRMEALELTALSQAQEVGI